MIIHLIDGTYELFRHFYGLRRFTKGNDRPFGAVAGVLNGILEMIEEGPIMSSSPFAISSGVTIRPARGSIMRCGRNFTPSKGPWKRWAWWFGQ